MNYVRQALVALAIAPIRFYQRFISPALPPTCRYYPSCSNYAIKAVQVHGPIKGILLGGWRLLRCNPWSLGGVDHVPDVGHWKPEPYVRPQN
ncbi:MAG: membrane protein insertion efficiency factor YidD [Actinomycetaceae bacterium]|nr:membrane protein insertion efficiency factor YidD [Actinomycetaceae bacterium]